MELFDRNEFRLWLQEYRSALYPELPALKRFKAGIWVRG